MNHFRCLTDYQVSHWRITLQPARIDLLVLAAKAGNQPAFGKLYQHYQQSVLRFAYKLCSDPSMAQDAVQEAWISCAKSLHKLHDVRQFRAWLFRTVRWRVMDQHRQSVTTAESQDDIVDDHSESVSDQLKQQELHQLIGQLPSVERESIHLFYLEQLTINEIALVLGVPAGTIKSRLNRARQHLRASYGESL